MTIKAYVLQTEDDEALVVARRKSACKACSAGCDGCSKAKNIKAVVENKKGAVKGDFVLVKYTKVNSAALTVFILPLILSIIVYFMAESSSRDYAAAVSVVVMLAAFVTLYIMVGKISYRYGKPVIEEIVGHDEEYSFREDD